MSRLRRADGLTMVELLVSLAVFATVMAGISVVFISSLRAWRTGRENRSVFQMARAASQFMQRDITSAFGSVDRDEVKTLVGRRKWLTFVGITENPPTWRQIPPDFEFEVPHSDMSRITYMLIGDLDMADQFLLIRLVEIDSDIIPGGYVNLDEVIEQTRAAWEAIILDANPDAEPGPDGLYVQPEDFELASNILDIEFSYGVLRQDEDLAERWGDGVDNDGDGFIDEADELWIMWDTLQDDPALATEFWNDMISWSPSWDSRYRSDRKLPDVIEVSLTVRAAAKLPTDETMVRVFRTKIFLPLGYRRPMPVALR